MASNSSNLTRIFALVATASALAVAACSVAPTEEESAQSGEEPAALTMSQAHVAELTYRITGDKPGVTLAQCTNPQNGLDMDNAGNTCMVNLPRADRIPAAGVCFGALDKMLGLGGKVGKLCNACIRVSLGDKSTVLRVVDRLREGQACDEQHIDLHCGVYADLLNQSGQAVYSSDGQRVSAIRKNGRDVKPTWQLTSCDGGARAYAVKTRGAGSWYALQVRNASTAVDSFELEQGGKRYKAQEGKNPDEWGFYQFFDLAQGKDYRVFLNGQATEDWITMPGAVNGEKKIYDASNGQYHSVETYELKPHGNGSSTPVAPPVAPPKGCSDAPPPAASGQPQYTCKQQADWGKCGEPWMAAYCNKSCGRCVCSDNAPPAASGQPQYTCKQQADWGKCGEPWMAGYCDTSCNRCN